MLSRICKDVCDLNILLLYHQIGFTDAASLEMGGEFAIFLDLSQLPSSAQQCEALAHELGHCATGCTHKVSSSWDLISKHEHKANRWAYEKYLPEEELRRLMQDGCTEVWQLAERLGFPEKTVRDAVLYWTECRGVDFNGL